MTLAVFILRPKVNQVETTRIWRSNRSCCISQPAAFLCPSLQRYVSEDDILASDFLKETQANDRADPDRLFNTLQALKAAGHT
jgi:hypothetical protein